MTDLNLVSEEAEEAPRTYDLGQEETIFVHLEDGKVTHVSVTSDTSGWCSCEQDYGGSLKYHIEHSCEFPEVSGFYMIEGCTGNYIQGDGWSVDDDSTFYPGNVRQATPEEISENE